MTYNRQYQYKQLLATAEWQSLQVHMLRKMSKGRFGWQLL